MDTSGRDATADTAAACTSDPADPCWVPIVLPSIPSGCVVSRALHPERIAPPRRVSCGTGCSRFETDAYWGGVSAYNNGWAGTDGFDYLWIGDSYARTGRYETDLLMRTDGQVVFAVSFVPWAPGRELSCKVVEAAARNGYAAFNLYWGRHPNLTPAQNILFYAPIGDISTVAEPVQIVDGGYGNEAVILDVSEHGLVWQLQMTGHTQGVLDGAYFDMRSNSGTPRLVGGDLFTAGSGIHHRAPDGSIRTTTVTFDPMRGTDGVLTDGHWVAWFDLVFTGNPIDTPRTLTLHAAQLNPAGGAALNPHVVEPPPGLTANEFMMGDGLAVHPEANADVTQITGYRVAELATGTLRHFVFPAGEHVGPTGLYLVSAHELVFETQGGLSGRPLYVVDPATLPLVP